jgi:glycosyltransferase involved in cell wall biosynthesis
MGSIEPAIHLGARVLSTPDPEVTLHLPADDVENPELSIVIPALNEELTIEEFIAWCKEGLAEAGVRGEILIVDSSTDRTAELALAGGARVLKTPKRGLGRAYIDALLHIRGRWILMGDADCTYDFRRLAPFVARFRDGYEFVMGSRFRGWIEPGSMPPLHQYLGTPVTTWILNVLYSGRFTDIHCGMRGITRDALARMGLESQSWEYASEMVLKSVHMELATAEVPVRFLKDREGRISHHKRAGWFSPWQAAWINLRAMFVYGADFFTLKPGIALLLLGVFLTIPQSMGPMRLGPVELSLYWMMFGLAISIVGLQSIYFGGIAQLLYDYTGDARRRWLRLFPYNGSVFASGLAFLAGVTLATPLVDLYFRSGLALPPDPRPANHLAITGLLFMIAGFMTFCFTLLLHAVALNVNRRPHPPR